MNFLIAIGILFVYLVLYCIYAALTETDEDRLNQRIQYMVGTAKTRRDKPEAAFIQHWRNNFSKFDLDTVGDIGFFEFYHHYPSEFKSYTEQDSYYLSGLKEQLEVLQELLQRRNMDVKEDLGAKLSVPEILQRREDYLEWHRAQPPRDGKAEMQKRYDNAVGLERELIKQKYLKQFG